MKQSGGKWPVRAYTLFAAFERVANAARGEEELKVWRIADSSTSFRSGVWKHFSFPPRQLVHRRSC